MSDSLIQSDLSELVIGLSSEHSYREITPTHTHTRAQFYMHLLELFRFSHRIMCGLCHPCALWIPAHVEHSVISLSHVKLNTALVEVNAAALMGQHCFIIRVSNLLHELLIRLNEIEREETPNTATSQELSRSLQILILKKYIGPIYCLSRYRGRKTKDS